MINDYLFRFCLRIMGILLNPTLQPRLGRAAPDRDRVKR